MSEVVTRPHVDNFIAWSADKPRVLVLTADLTNSCEVGQWSSTYPDRYFSLGMAEQNLVGFAAGLAREGFEPWLHTFAVFLYRRPLDQVQMSVAYPNLPVRLVGFLPGLMTPGGVTHQAIDDLAVMRAMPNMTILETGDATEVETVLDVAHAVDGPVYIRMLRGEVPRLFDRAEPMQFGVARDLTPSVADPRVTLLTSGICTEEALRAMPAIEAAGVTVKHLHISTIKPFDDPRVLDAISGASAGVITMENHLRTGGLGSAVAELIAEHGIGTRLTRIGIHDTYCHGASLAHLQQEYGIDATALCRAVADLCQVAVDDTNLIDAREIQVHSSARAEAL